jgi:GT2 family glycosyltransferase
VPDEIVVIDNGSDDGTPNWLQDQNLTVIRQENLGSAGGFHRGISEAFARGHDWFWCMDDDVIPAATALQGLLDASVLVGSAGFICSMVRFVDGASANLPTVDARPVNDAYANWDQYLRQGIVKVESATFVSIMFSRAAVAEKGLPLRQFHIWGDDSEYTSRLTSYAPGFVTGHSEVQHLRAAPKPPSLMTESNVDRIPLYRNMVRNHLYLLRRARRRMLSRFIAVVRYAIYGKSLLKSTDYRIKRITVFIHGFWDGLWFSPRVEYVLPEDERVSVPRE